MGTPSPLTGCRLGAFTPGGDPLPQDAQQAKGGPQKNRETHMQ